MEVEGGATGRVIELRDMSWAQGGGRCLRGCIEVDSVVLGLLDV